MASNIVLPLPRICGLEAATCSPSLLPLSLLPWTSSIPPHAHPSPTYQHRPQHQQQQHQLHPKSKAQELRGDVLARPRTAVRRGVHARSSAFNATRRPRSNRPEATPPSSHHHNAASFSTSISKPAPSNFDSPPVTFATPCQATYDLLKNWHRSISSSASRQEQQSHAIPANPSKLPPEEMNRPLQADLRAHNEKATASSDSSTTTPPLDQVSSYLDSPTNDINALMRHPALFENIRAPRNPIVLCHGLYGFDVRGPFLGLEIHYWAAALDILRNKIGAEVIVRGVPGTGSIPSRAKALHDYLCSDEADVKGAKLNFVGHSMGGLDARYLVSHIKPKPEEYVPVSVTTISTPHRGSPFMDWCNANVGIGNEYVEEAIREYEEKQGNMEGGVKMRDGPKGDPPGHEKHPYSLKTPLFVRPKKNGNGDKDQAKDAEVSKKAVEEMKQAKKEEASKRSSSPVSEEDGVKEQIIDAAETVIDKLTPDNTKVDLSSSSTLKSLKSLGFVSPLTRALSSFGGFFSSYMLSVFDQPAYAMLSTRYMAKVFNPSTPDSPDVSYFSIAARIPKMPLWHPLWLPKVILNAAAESRTAGAERDGSAAALGKPDEQGNDGLVSVPSAKWGQFLGVVEEKDHWDLRGSGAPRWGSSGKINPATGKPFKNAAAASKQATFEKEAAERQAPKTPSKEKSDDGWLMINRMLGSLLGSRSSGKNGKQPAEDVKVKDPAAVKTSDSKDASVLIADATESAKAFLDNYATLSGPDGAASTSPSPASSDKLATNGGNESGLANEVASWISDRLPQGSEERRKLADEAARLQQSGISGHGQLDGSVPDSDMVTLASQPTQDAISSASSSSSADGQAAVETLPNSTSGWNATASLAAVTTEQRQMLKLRREADWLESTGQMDNARELRREIEWHRDEYNARCRSAGGEQKRKGVDIGPGPDSALMQNKKRREMEAAEGSAGKGQGSIQTEEEKRKKKERSEQEELERFWIALCQHLHAHGY
ncbi:alpha/beta-hydrolase [Microstroma glucosiphilum]|uniref:Alpha/beta-hydrolase n=1 Tax=Pseudomicrostroma glucosiphilum TaxID=1684307 RepID=A0A316UDD6_9BASI|nr:alpha/beta-hydrolase [Pseudomicrostroma glucosiphilum]PWN23216.1 alpha/beta-hydrolase [Pseudomicrostroma glucosiphilum]